MKHLICPFFNGVRTKMMNYLKELIAPGYLEGVRLNLFVGSIRESVRFLKSQKPEK